MICGQAEVALAPPKWLHLCQVPVLCVNICLWKVLIFWKQRSRRTCLQHRNPAGLGQHHWFKATTQARLKINYHWADVLSLYYSTRGKSYYVSPGCVRTVELSLGVDMSSLFRVYTHTHMLTGVEDKVCGSKQKWHPIHLSWPGSDVLYLILQGLALWNDIGLAPAKTSAVFSIPEAGLFYTADTLTAKLICLSSAWYCVVVIRCHH